MVVRAHLVQTERKNADIVVIPGLTIKGTAIDRKLVTEDGIELSNDDVIQLFKANQITGVQVMQRLSAVLPKEYPMFDVIADIKDDYVFLSHSKMMISKQVFHEWYELD